MQELLQGAGVVCIYYVVAASTMLTLRWFLRIPNELFRKILHFILLGSYIPFAFAFETWWLSVLLAIIMEILIYPILAWAHVSDQTVDMRAVPSCQEGQYRNQHVSNTRHDKKVDRK